MLPLGNLETALCIRVVRERQYACVNLAADTLYCEASAMAKTFLINVAGADRPGLTSSLMGCLAEHEVRALDIGQAVVHENLALAILIELPSEEDFTSLKKELLVRGHDLELKIQFTSVSRQAFEHWVQS